MLQLGFLWRVHSSCPCSALGLSHPCMGKGGPGRAGPCLVNAAHRDFRLCITRQVFYTQEFPNSHVCSHWFKGDTKYLVFQTRLKGGEGAGRWVIDKIFLLCPSSPLCSVAASSRDRVQECCWDQKAFVLPCPAGQERRVPFSCSMSNGLPESSSSTLCGADPRGRGTTWDGLYLFQHRQAAIQRPTRYSHHINCEGLEWRDYKWKVFLWC